MASPNSTDEFDQLIKEWHKYWLNNGEPHPSSNEYLRMTRIFFFVSGFEKGLQVAEDLTVLRD